MCVIIAPLIIDAIVFSGNSWCIVRRQLALYCHMTVAHDYDTRGVLLHRSLRCRVGMIKTKTIQDDEITEKHSKNYAKMFYSKKNSTKVIVYMLNYIYIYVFIYM